MATVVFPGSFDPFHLGHLAVVEWAAATYDEVVVAVLANPEKPVGMFAPDVRVQLASRSTAHLHNVRCMAFSGLTGTLARDEAASAIIRSAHKEADLERTLAVLNKFMSHGVPTVFAPADPATEAVSSTLLRRLLRSGDGDAASQLVPAAAREELREAVLRETVLRETVLRETVAREAERRPVRDDLPGVARPGPIQAAPVLLDRDATLDRALELIDDAAGQDPQLQDPRLVVFPEAFLPGYPDWIGRTKPGDEPAKALYGTLFDNSVVIGSAFTQVLGEACHRYGLYLSIGISEREPTGSVLYSSQLLFGPDRRLLSVHRQLMPAGGERLVWGPGQGSGLRVVETPFGRVGTVTSSGNYLPLARAALYAQGVDIYLAPAWDTSEVWSATLRHIAREGGAFVIGVNQYLRSSQLPRDLPWREEIYGDGDYPLNDGNSMIVGPDGHVVAGPLSGQAGFVAATIDANQARHHRHQFGAASHHGRPDLFSLQTRLDDPPESS
jgi:nitrilase